MKRQFISRWPFGITLAVLSAFICMIAYADNYNLDEIVKSYQANKISIDSFYNEISKPEYATERFEWGTKMAKRNNGMGQYLLGRCYRLGDGCVKDYDMSLKYLEESANNANTDALVDLGNIWSSKEYAGYNPSKALSYFHLASDAHNARGIYHLGLCYQWGDNGVEIDYIKALSYFRKAIIEGELSYAYVSLGYMNENGLGLDINLPAAKRMYQRAAENGNEIALYNMGIIYKNGKVKWEVEENSDLALKYFLASAEKGFGNAMYECGDHYYFNYKYINSNRDEIMKAKKWFEKGIEKENKPCFAALGELYLDGEGVEKDIRKGIELSEKGKGYGSFSQYCHIANCYMKGEGCQKDLMKALEWANLAYDDYHKYYEGSEEVFIEDACHILAKIYLDESLDIYDYSKAVKYLQEGANYNDLECIQLLEVLGEPYEVKYTGGCQSEINIGKCN